MNFEIDDIITIEENNYFVSKISEKETKKYIFLIKLDENEEPLEEIDIVLLNEDNTLSEISDELYSKLYEEFLN